MQANRLEHSALLMHSGRQFGGDPTYSSIQAQDDELFITWHKAFRPHGDGLHGFMKIGGVSTKTYISSTSNLITD